MNGNVFVQWTLLLVLLAWLMTLIAAFGLMLLVNCVGDWHSKSQALVRVVLVLCIGIVACGYIRPILQISDRVEELEDLYQATLWIAIILPVICQAVLAKIVLTRSIFGGAPQ